MVVYVFAVKDKAAGTFGRPFYANSKGLAIRSFTDEVNRSAQDNMMYMHPDDFDLYYLCNYNEDDGMFCYSDEIKSPEVIARGSLIKLIVKE